MKTIEYQFARLYKSKNPTTFSAKSEHRSQTKDYLQKKIKQHTKYAIAFMAVCSMSVFAEPQGGQVISGNVQIQQTGSPGQVTTHVLQNSTQAQVNWKSFNVKQGETVNFVQPSKDSLIVNRIEDTAGSTILGRINANGQVWLINPNGVIFGKDAQINVGGLIASTLNNTDVNSGLLKPPSELKAGELSGTTDMVIDAQPASSMNSVVTSDNFGSRYTGRERAGAFISWNNVTQSADTLLLSALSSGSNLNFQQLGYVLPVYRPGMSMGFSMAHMQYVLGNGAESLKAHGHLSQVSYWLLYPLLSTNETKSDIHLQYEETELDDHQDSTGTKNDRQLNKLNVSVNLDRSDAVWNGGVTQINANLTFGRVFFNDAVALANDAATVNTAGEFVKLNVRASRNQSIDQTWSLVLSADAQVANRNLDATQKFSVGGYQSVRAFESGVLSADEALFVSLECRARLPNPPPKFNISGEWYGALFWDGAMTRINKHTWSSSSNHATLRGSGVGVYWQGLDNWRASLAWATAQGVMPDVLAGSISNHRSVWLELSKGWR